MIENVFILYVFILLKEKKLYVLLKSGKYVKKTSSILLYSYKCTLQLIVLKWLNSDLLEPLKSCLDPLRELWDLLHEDVRSRYSRELAQGFLPWRKERADYLFFIFWALLALWAWTSSRVRPWALGWREAHLRLSIAASYVESVMGVSWGGIVTTSPPLT